MVSISVILKMELRAKQFLAAKAQTHFASLVIRFHIVKPRLQRLDATPLVMAFVRVGDLLENLPCPSDTLFGLL